MKRASKATETVENVKAQVEDLAQRSREAAEKALDEYFELNTRLQDEMLAATGRQVKSLREMADLALNSQVELYGLFEANCRSARDLWRESIRSWIDTIKASTPAL